MGLHLHRPATLKRTLVTRSFPTAMVLSLAVSVAACGGGGGGGSGSGNAAGQVKDVVNQFGHTGNCGLLTPAGRQELSGDTDLKACQTAIDQGTKPTYTISSVQVSGPTATVAVAGTEGPYGIHLTDASGSWLIDHIDQPANGSSGPAGSAPSTTSPPAPATGSSTSIPASSTSIPASSTSIPASSPTTNASAPASSATVTGETISGDGWSATFAPGWAKSADPTTPVDGSLNAVEVGAPDGALLEIDNPIPVNGRDIVTDVVTTANSIASADQQWGFTNIGSLKDTTLGREKAEIFSADSATADGTPLSVINLVAIHAGRLYTVTFSYVTSKGGVADNSGLSTFQNSWAWT